MASTERVYHNYPGAAYILPADEEEHRRLEVQHETIKAFFGGRLIPDRVQIRPGWKILDSGTGTGVWALDAAKESPSDVQFIGIDISFRLYPASLPENISLVQESILAPPKEWLTSSSFDLVHQRLLMGGLRRPDWIAAIQKIFTILKPGGYVVLNELDGIEDHGPGSASQKLWEIVGEAFAKLGLLLECASALPTMLEAAGFVDIVQETRKITFGREGDKVAEVWLKNTMMGFARGVKAKIVKVEGMNWKGSEDDLEGLIVATEKEYQGMPGKTMPIVWTTARKPL